MFGSRYGSRYLCGCYHATQDINGRSTQTYLPLLTSESHTSLISTSYRTTLKQFFHNPSDKDIKECIYTFPLYDGVALVSFKCHVGGRTLRGVVKEKNKAKEVYDEAVARGETAGLMEQLPEASDVFSTKLGNIPAGETVVVEIEYVGELKQEAETNGVRFTIPTNIAPRYGSVTSSSAAPSARASGIQIVVDAQMPTGSNIQGIQSPSHPISVAMGKISSEKTDAEASLSKASASLSLEGSSLDKDFVLIVLAKDTAIPRAILEKHPTIEDQRALMMTLVTKFSLPPSRPEIVFVADRSGSMGGNIPILISAMRVFLKSLPVGVKFNICSFGSHHEFLWPKSKSYAQDTLKEAMSYVERFDADFGGTETFGAIKATIERRFTDIPLEVMLLTDGDIWQQDELFRYLNEEVDKSQGKIRVFPLGIGDGVSHALIEGVARAGNGFAQAVQEGEKLDNRVVRMLKGALSPHITDYTLEVKYRYEQSVGDDFEMIEKFDKVTDGFQVSATEVQEEEKPKQQKSISLFNPDVDPNAEDNNLASDASGQNRYAHLPDITLPKLLQAPHKIPTLFPFTRTSVYLLMTPAHVSHEPESVILRATSPEGPLELEIPVEVMPEPAETIHQLAVKKAVQDLEEGRGWIYEAKDEKGVSIKERYPSRFEDMVEREAVRLGTQFGIAGKWCSFVAVADNASEDDDGQITGTSRENVFSNPGYSLRKRPADLAFPLGNASNGFERSELSELSAAKGATTQYQRHCMPNQPQHMAQRLSMVTQSVMAQRQSMVPQSFMAAGSPAPATRGLFGVPAPPPYIGSCAALPATRGASSIFSSSQGSGNRGGAPSGQPQASENTKSKKRSLFGGSIGGGLFGKSSPTSTSASASSFSISRPAASMSIRSPGQGGVQGVPRGVGMPSSVLMSFGDAPQAATAAVPAPYAPPAPMKAFRQRMGGLDRCAPPHQPSPELKVDSADSDDGFGNLDDVTNHTNSEGNGPKSTYWTTASDEEKVHRLIALQDFEGFWEPVAEVWGIMSLKGKDYKEERTLKGGEEGKAWTTILVVTFLEQKMKAEAGVWDLVVEKARAWLQAMKGEREMETLEAEARAMFG
jgi:hypothetical protein